VLPSLSSLSSCPSSLVERRPLEQTPKKSFRYFWAVVTLPASVIAGLADGYLRILPISLRAYLTAMVGAAIALSRYARV